MSLEFNQVVHQVYKMGAMLEHLDFDLTETIDTARKRFENSGDLERAYERIEWVRSSDISGYRGAAPVDLPDAEPINAVIPEPSMPEQAIVIAADGSQVYPDELAPVHYYLINLGIFVYHHGFEITPEQFTYPDLRFHKDHVHDRYGRLIRNRVVDDRRTVAEMRKLAEEAWPGDIIGIPNHGNLRIGDSLTEGEELKFTGIPSFAPEYIQTVRAEDPMKAKHLSRALHQLAEEGAARVFKPVIGAEWYVGVVGMLQFEVMADRIRTEYDVPCRFENTSLYTAQWVEGDDPFKVKKFADANKANMAEDHNGSPVFLARNSWRLDKAVEENPDLRFLKTKEQLV